MNSLVSLKAVNKIFKIDDKEVIALSSINLEISSGERLAIIGPSGAGKSTLLHLLGLLDTPTAGDVYFQEKKVSQLTQSEQAGIRNKKIGFLFQAHHLLPEFTALENVMLPALIEREKNNRQEIARRAEKMLALVGITDRKEHYRSQLSGGEAQRVALARALINGPQILLADEPTGNLDQHTGRKIEELLWQIQQEKNLTIVIVTHNEALSNQAARIISLVDGQIFNDLRK
ncbi:MAG: ABC transporter ATP-binding protein [Elusimicrobiota bacterium]